MRQRIGLDECEGVDEVGRRDQVADLPIRNLCLSRLAFVFPEAGEIECERGVTAFGEADGVGLGHLLFDR
jgi:hypothetical protein